MKVLKAHFLSMYGPYLARPALWPEIWRREVSESLARRFGLGAQRYPSPQERVRLCAKSSSWCQEVAVSMADAFFRIGASIWEKTIEEEFVDVYRVAGERVAACPVRMGGAANATLLYVLCEHLEAKRVIETGVAYGWSTLAILLSLRNRAGSKLWSVDLPYFELRNDSWIGCAVPPGMRGPWYLYRMADREGLPRALHAAGSIDIAHHDSDKSSFGRRWAYECLWRGLRPGGILVCDDVGDNLAYRNFCEERNLEPLVVQDSNKYQGLAVKPMEEQG